MENKKDNKKKNKNNNAEENIKKELPKLSTGIKTLGKSSLETNIFLEKISKTLDFMSFSLNLKIATLVSSFDTYFNNLRDFQLRDGLKNDNQVKKFPTKEEKGGFSPSPLSSEGMSGLASNLLTAFGLALMSFKFNIGKIIQEAGIITIFSKFIRAPILAIGRSISGLFDIGILKGVKYAFNMLLFPFKLIMRFCMGIVKNPIVQALGKIIGGIGKFIFRIFNIINPFAGVFSTILKFAGKLFLPFTVAMTLIDFYKGFMKSDNWVDGIKTGLIEVFNGIIGYPLNLLRDLFVWVTKKLGWEKFSKFLENVDFTIIITRFFTDIWDFFNGLFTMNFPKMKQAAGDWLGFVWSGLKNVFSFVIEKLGDLLVSIGDKIMPILSSLWESVTDIFWQLIDNVKSWGENIFKNISDFATPWIEAICKPFQDIFSKIGDLLVNMKETILKKLREWLPSWLLPDWAKEETPESRAKAEDELKDKEIKQLQWVINDETDKIERSKKGSYVYQDDNQDRARSVSLQKIEEAKKVIKEIEIKKEQNMKNVANNNQNNTVIISNTGNTNTSSSNVSVNNITGTPTTARPDR